MMDDVCFLAKNLVTSEIIDTFAGVYIIIFKANSKADEKNYT